MSPRPSPPPRPPHRTHRLRASRGFSLVELAVVTLIIAMLAALGLPAMKRAALSARASAVVSDLRVFSAAFQTYAQQNGGYPPESGIGVMPPLMVGTLGTTSWLRVTPIGGRYNWEYNRSAAGVRYRAGLGIRTRGTARVTNDAAQLLAIDRLIDDGDLTTGAFFIGTGREPFYVVER